MSEGEKKPVDSVSRLAVAMIFYAENLVTALPGYGSWPRPAPSQREWKKATEKNFGNALLEAASLELTKHI